MNKRYANSHSSPKLTHIPNIPFYPYSVHFHSLMAERGLPRAAPNPDTLGSPILLPCPSLPFPSLPFPVLFPAVCAGAVIFVSGSGAPPSGAILPEGPAARRAAGEIFWVFFALETPKNGGLRPFWAIFEKF